MSTRKGTLGKLVHDDLMYGHNHCRLINLGRYAFETDDEAEAAWDRHRDSLMTEARAEARRWPLCFRRPWAFWMFDSGRPDLAYDWNDIERVRVLADLGELTHEERSTLLREGRAARDRLGTPAEAHFTGTPGVGPDATAAAIADVLEES